MNNILSHKNYFFDMDGVLAEWIPATPGTEEDLVDAINRILYAKDHYLNLAPNESIIRLANLLSYQENANIYICSCYLPDKGDISPKTQKLDWIERYMPFIPKSHIVLVPDTTNKADYIETYVLCRPLDKDDILFDDYHKNLTEWSEHNGTPIKVLNGFNSEHSNADMYRIKAKGNGINLANELTEIFISDSHTLAPLETIYCEILYEALINDLSNRNSQHIDELDHCLTEYLFPELINNGGTPVYDEQNWLEGVTFNDITYYRLTDECIKKAYKEHDTFIRIRYHISPCEEIYTTPRPLDHTHNPYKFLSNFKAEKDETKEAADVKEKDTECSAGEYSEEQSDKEEDELAFA